MDCLLNLVFITDENYAEPTAVAIESIICNKKATTKCNIHIGGYKLSNEARFKRSKLADMHVSIEILEIPDLEKILALGRVGTLH